MPLVHIKSPELTLEQKMRIGDCIISAFCGEGLPAESVVVLFEREVADIYLGGSKLFGSSASVDVTPGPAPELAAPVVAPEAPEPSVDFKSKVRRSKGELQTLKRDLVASLQARGALSSFQAQLELGLKACDWAPATLRRFFSELEEEGAIVKQGQKRGTRYVWQGLTSQQAPGPQVTKLVKHPDEASEG